MCQIIPNFQASTVIQLLLTKNSSMKSLFFSALLLLSCSVSAQVDVVLVTVTNPSHLYAPTLAAGEQVQLIVTHWGDVNLVTLEAANPYEGYRTGVAGTQGASLALNSACVEQLLPEYSMAYSRSGVTTFNYSEFRPHTFLANTGERVEPVPW